MRLHTHTDPYPATASVALNEAGLGAVIPAGAKFPDHQAAAPPVPPAGPERSGTGGRGDSLYVLAESDK